MSLRLRSGPSLTLAEAAGAAGAAGELVAAAGTGSGGVGDGAGYVAAGAADGGAGGGALGAGADPPQAPEERSAKRSEAAAALKYVQASISRNSNTGPPPRGAARIDKVANVSQSATPRTDRPAWQISARRHASPLG